MRTLFSILLLFRFATSLSIEELLEQEYQDELDYLEEVLTEPVVRKFHPDMSNEPPKSNSQIANLFNSNLYSLLSTNEVQYLEVIVKYMNRDTRILSCHAPGKDLNTAMLQQRLKYLYLYFKSIAPAGFSFTTSSPTHATFTSKFKGITQDKKEILLEWQGEAIYDLNRDHYMFSRIEMLQDCSQIPTEFPKEPQQSIHDFIDTLRSQLENDYFKTGLVHQMANYQAFAAEFLLSKARVKMCEKKSVVDRVEFAAYLYKRFGQSNPVFSGLEFRTEKFSDYQTDAIFTVIVKFDSGAHTQEQFKFRISSLAEEPHGWLFWLADFVEVGCPIDLKKQPDPSDTKGKFVEDVCGSIPAMINDGQGTSTRWKFLEYMLQRKDGGFFAIIKGYDNGRITGFDSFTSWLEMWASGYQKAKLAKDEILDEQNMSFKCTLELQTKDEGVIEEEFQMRAYFETDKWLVKEVRVGFGAKRVIRNVWRL